MIDWQAFDWQSFTTLVTGGLAVCAAIVVGLRQLRVLDGQNRIAGQALRLDLLDRRIRVLSALKSAEFDLVADEFQIDDKFKMNLLNIIQEAELLFPESCSQQIAQLYANVYDVGEKREDKFELAMEIIELHSLLAGVSRVRLDDTYDAAGPLIPTRS